MFLSVKLSDNYACRYIAVLITVDCILKHFMQFYFYFINLVSKNIKSSLQYIKIHCLKYNVMKMSESGTEKNRTESSS